MHLRKVLLGSIAALLAAIPALVMAASLELRDAAVAKAVEDRAPVGTSSNFDSSVGRLYAFTRIVGADGDTKIYHKWYHGDVLVADVPLTVRSGDWRTWSSKNVVPDWTGDWRVVVVSEDGSVLGTVKFNVN